MLNATFMKKQSSASLRLGVKKPGSRFIAIEILNQWEQSRDAIDSIIEQHLSALDQSDPRDLHLVQAMVYGVLRHLSVVDRVIGTYSKHPLNKMKSRTLCALRVGLFQLLFMDRVPASAAINETVEALKQAGQPKWLYGFVNGLLRTLSKNKENITKQLEDKELGLAVRFNHPDWLVNRWIARYGASEAESMCRVNMEQPPISLHINTKKIAVDDFLKSLQDQGMTGYKGQYAEQAVLLEDLQGPIPNVPGYEAGHFHVQDEAAQLVTQLLGSFNGPRRYLDGCAGLGGKSMQLAQLAAQKAEIDIVEPSTMRSRLFEENCRRLGVTELFRNVFHGNLEDFAPDEKYDAILIDAPCSGLGVIRRHPDIKWNRSPEDLKVYQQKQLALLETAAALLKEAGILVYAVCSMEPEENEQVIDLFLQQHPDFTITDSKNFLPPKAAPLVDARGFLRTTPLDGLDGFFAARLKKLKVKSE